MVNFKNEDIFENIKCIELFRELTDSELRLFVSIIETESFLKDSIIIKEGEAGDKLYILYRGEVEVRKTTVYGDEYTCSYLNSGMHCFFGEISLLDNDIRSATVASISDVETLVIRRDAFNAFCEENKEIGYKLLKGMTKRLCKSLRKLNKEVITLFEALVDEIGQAR